MVEHREAPRRRVCFGGRIRHERVFSDTECRLRNLSIGGACLRLSEAIPLPDRFDLVVACRGVTHRAEVVWRRDDEIGVRFVSDAVDARDDRIAALRTSLSASRAEAAAAALRERLAALEAGIRQPNERLH